MSNFILNCINPTTTIIESSGALQVPLTSLTTSIKEGINKRLATITHRRTASLGYILLEAIIEENSDITNMQTFNNSMFQGIALLKQQNTLNTRRFCLACINFFITPATYTAHTTIELLCYAYQIAKNPLLITRLCPNGDVQLNHDYYPDLVALQANTTHQTD